MRHGLGSLSLWRVCTICLGKVSWRAEVTSGGDPTKTSLAMLLLDRHGERMSRERLRGLKYPSNRTAATYAAGWRDTREYERLDDAGKLRAQLKFVPRYRKVSPKMNRPLVIT